MPFFSIVATSASATPPRLHSSMKACSSGLSLRRRVASGCSAAIAQNVTPMIVSARVVNTRSSFCSPSISYGKPKVHAEALADPVLLHDLHALGPARDLRDRSAVRPA